jgi:RimJ/RimL family protein N-acetyltransferase
MPIAPSRDDLSAEIGYWRLAERAGFTREGTLRRYRRRHGVREDLVMFSLLAEDLE